MDADQPISSDTPDAPAPARESVLHLDSTALQVLAHPLRIRLLAALRTDGPATATTLAAVLDTNTGATSYHLRRLASVGLVEEAGGGRGRERRWQASTAAHGWTERDIAGDPDAEAAGSWLRHAYLRAFVEASEAWLAAQSDWPLEWRTAADSGDYLVRVSPDRLERLREEIEDVIARYREAAEDEEAVEPVLLYLHTIPLAVVPRGWPAAGPPTIGSGPTSGAGVSREDAG